MANYYVSPSGNGTQSGVDLANAMAWATFEAGAMTTLNPGDFVYCADGTYTRSTTISVTRSGTGTGGTYTSTSPITFTYATTARGPHFEGPDYSAGPPVTEFRGFLVTGTDVHFVGIKVSRMTLDGIRFENQRCVADNCYFLRNGMSRSDSQDGGQGLMIAGSGLFATVKNSLLVENREHGVYAAGEVDDVIIEDNIFRYNGYDWDGNPAKGGVSAVQANGNGPGNACNRIIVRRNHIFYSSGQAVLFLETHDSDVYENYFYGNTKDTISIDSVSTGCSVYDNQIASSIRTGMLIRGSGHTITGNRMWTKATNNSANVGIGYNDPASIVSSANNVFHRSGPSVARDESPVAYKTLAQYKSETSDTTSTEVTNGTISQFHADIQAWINGGAIILLPPDPAVGGSEPELPNPLINAIDFLRDNQVTGGYRGTHLHLFTWTATPPGFVSGSVAVSLAPTGTLSGSGSLSGATTVTLVPSGTLFGSGLLSGLVAIAVSPTGTILGTGTLTGASTITITCAGLLSVLADAIVLINPTGVALLDNGASLVFRLNNGETTVRLLR